MHRSAAAELLGAVADAVGAGEPYEEILPPAPARRRLPSTALPLAETVELVAALVKSGQPTDEEFETALDALVRHAHQDRAADVAAA